MISTTVPTNSAMTVGLFLSAVCCGMSQHDGAGFVLRRHMGRHLQAVQRLLRPQGAEGESCHACTPPACSRVPGCIVHHMTRGPFMVPPDLGTCICIQQAAVHGGTCTKANAPLLQVVDVPANLAGGTVVATAASTQAVSSGNMPLLEAAAPKSADQAASSSMVRSSCTLRLDVVHDASVCNARW